VDVTVYSRSGVRRLRARALGLTAGELVAAGAIGYGSGLAMASGWWLIAGGVVGFPVALGILIAGIISAERVFREDGARLASWSPKHELREPGDTWYRRNTAPTEPAGF
jgi:hypothetical protein